MGRQATREYLARMRERYDRVLPFTGVPSLTHPDYVITLNTPRVRGLSFNTLTLWGKDENFLEWSSANFLRAASRRRQLPAPVIRAPHGRLDGGDPPQPSRRLLREAELPVQDVGGSRVMLVTTPIM